MVQIETKKDAKKPTEGSTSGALSQGDYFREERGKCRIPRTEKEKNHPGLEKGQRPGAGKIKECPNKAETHPEGLVKSGGIVEKIEFFKPGRNTGGSPL